MGWWNNFWNRVIKGRKPSVDQRKSDSRRQGERRWMGASGEKPRAIKDPRRKKERRKGLRRKSVGKKRI